MPVKSLLFIYLAGFALCYSCHQGGSFHMTTLSFQGGEARHLLARLLDIPNLPEGVPTLEPKVLHQLVRHFGLEECGDILAMATPHQLTQIFDEDLWSSNRPG